MKNIYRVDIIDDQESHKSTERVLWTSYVEADAEGEITSMLEKPLEDKGLCVEVTIASIVDILKVIKDIEEC